MDTLIENFDEVRAGFELTLLLLVFSAFFATVLGVVLGSMRVSPVASLRWVGTAYVNVFRNTPLAVVLALSVGFWPNMGLPRLSFLMFGNFETFALIGLSAYTAAFVCEAVRSGINSVPAGQAEAARSVGMTFFQTLRGVVLPQATAAVIPPMTNIYIALAKNTSVVATVGVFEAAATMRRLGNKFGDVPMVFLGFALGYVIIVLAISGLSRLVERRVAVSR
jgi:glutamate transport system permease protein